jgi:hypothetical protein
MFTKPYGTTGMNPSVIGFGGMRFPEPDKIDEMASLVTYAHERGINYFDTAPGYCADKSEEIFGAAIADLDRDSFYIATKSMQADGDKLRSQAETSLKRLGVEYLDVLHIWCVMSQEAYKGRVDGGAVAAALRLKDEGLVRHVAVSSHMPGDELAAVLDDGPFEGVLLGYSAINFPLRQKAVDMAGRKGMGVVTMNPLAGGVIPDQAERFSFLKGDADDSVVTAALRFNVSQPDVTVALVGFSTTDHIDEAVAAVADFTPYGEARVEDIRQQVLDSFDGLCTGCGYCLPCPEGVPIPKLMDTYNQRILNPEANMNNRLKWHWGMDATAAKACSLCGACEKRCTQHLPIRDRIKAIAELADEA